MQSRNVRNLILPIGLNTRLTVVGPRHTAAPRPAHVDGATPPQRRHTLEVDEQRALRQPLTAEPRLLRVQQKVARHVPRKCHVVLGRLLLLLIEARRGVLRMLVHDFIDGGRLREERWAADAEAEERALPRFPGPVLHPRCRALATPGVRRTVALTVNAPPVCYSTAPLPSSPV